MSPTATTTATLDTILALQFTVAWAGEGLCDPPRLKWWRTDLVDEAGGGDLLRRLAPRTHRWAALAAVRRAAFLTDLKARSGLSDPDGVTTLFFWGFELDEKLGERIRELKWLQVSPEEALGLSVNRFDRARLEQALGPQPAYSLQPAGRELKGPMPSEPAEAARKLAGALLPLTDIYPAPYFRR